MVLLLAADSMCTKPALPQPTSCTDIYLCRSLNRSLQTDKAVLFCAPKLTNLSHSPKTLNPEHYQLIQFFLLLTTGVGRLKSKVDPLSTLGNMKTSQG